MAPDASLGVATSTQYNGLWGPLPPHENEQFSTGTRPANALSPESSFPETAEMKSNILHSLKTATAARLWSATHHIGLYEPIFIETPQLQQDYVIAMNLRYLIAAFALVTFQTSADNSTLDAAIGGAIGGGAGAAIGNEVGGRDGAIIGGALGGAVGAAVSTDDDNHHHSSYRKAYYDYDHDHYYRDHHHHSSGFCPPGQAKKGNCWAQ
jgi:hypothetical protein